MRQTTSKPRVLHKKRRMILGVLLLAALCLAAAELVACRIADPVLYAQVTEPARVCARKAAVVGRAAADEIGRAAAAAAREAEEAGQAIAAEAARLSKKVEKALAPKVTAPQKHLMGRGNGEAQVASPFVPPAPQGMVDEAVSRLEGREDLEFLTGSGIDVVYYNQADEQWSGVRYGSDSLSGYGCGPTAMSMVVSTLLQNPVPPADMAAECVQRGYWAKRSGSYLSIVEGIASAYGLECSSIPPEQLNRDELILHLSTGDLAVALMTRGHFTNSGHFIVLRGMTLEGDVLVADPASRERSLTPWSMDLILSELSSSRHNGAPLWLICRSAGVG